MSVQGQQYTIEWININEIAKTLTKQQQLQLHLQPTLKSTFKVYFMETHQTR